MGCNVNPTRGARVKARVTERARLRVKATLRQRTRAGAELYKLVGNFVVV